MNTSVGFVKLCQHHGAKRLDNGFSPVDIQKTCPHLLPSNFKGAKAKHKALVRRKMYETKLRERSKDI
jgi:hypothetical protein